MMFISDLERRPVPKSKGREIVFTLIRKIRVVSLPQVARGWWGNSPRDTANAKRLLDSLVAEGVLTSFVLRAHPELPLQERIWSWGPGEPRPPYGIISYQARKRWTKPLIPTAVYVASTRSARLYGGSGGRLAHPLQVTHDLHVSAIYLRLLVDDPQSAERWVSEDVLAPLLRGKKIPDAELRDERGCTLKVIEFGGSYPPERIRKVHEDCDRRQVPYELW
jgi:hypothetical protein